MGERERGSASIIVCLALLLVVVVLGLSMSMASTTAQITERERLALDRAALNARSGLAAAGPWLESTLGTSLRAVLDDAAGRNFDVASSSFLSLEFPRYARRFAMQGSIDSEEDFAQVSADVTLAGAPLRRSMGGAGAGQTAMLVDEYRFNAHVVSEGNTAGAKDSYEQDFLVIVYVQAAPTS